MKKALLPFLFLFFVPIASAQILLEPSSFHIEMVGGENTTKTISLVWKGEAPVVAYLGYEIEQVNGSFSGSEMRVEFSENPVILEPNKVKKVEVTIATRSNIYPGEYLVRIFANTSVEQVVEEEMVSRIVKKIILENVTVPKNVTVIKWFENKTKISQLEEQIENLENKLANYSSYIDDLESEIREKNEAIGFYTKIAIVSGAVLGLVLLFVKKIKK